MNPKRTGVLFIVLAAILWSSGGIGIKAVTEGPLAVAFYRSLFAAVTLLLLFRREVLMNSDFQRSSLRFFGQAHTPESSRQCRVQGPRIELRKFQLGQAQRNKVYASNKLFQIVSEKRQLEQAVHARPRQGRAAKRGTTRERRRS